jgi:hypothetical protein
MKAVLTVLALAALLVLCAGQAGYKLEGSYRRAACACSNALPGAGCDDMWLTEYNNVRYAGFGWTAPDPSGVPPLRPFSFTAVGNEFQLNANVGQAAGYDCHGIIGREMICETTNRTTEFCRVTFECTAGDCITAVATWNMRSIMFPVVGAVLAVVWLLMAFVKGLPVDVLSMVVALVIFIFCLFLLVSPNVFPALMAMAFAALSLLASRSKGGWERKLAVIAGIFVFLAFAGLNSFAFAGTNIFDDTMSGFLSESCFRYYGLELKSARCAQYLLFSGFLGFLIMMLTPLLVLTLLMAMNKSDGDK